MKARSVQHDLSVPGEPPGPEHWYDQRGQKGKGSRSKWYVPIGQEIAPFVACLYHADTACCSGYDIDLSPGLEPE